MSEQTMREIAARLRQRRLELDTSYQQLAQLTGMSKSTLQRYESGGIKNLPLSKLKELAQALRLDPQELMGWNDPPDGLDKVYFNFARQAQQEQIDPQDIQAALDMIKKLRGR